MKRILVLTVTLGVFLIGGRLYAASGDLVVNGNLTVGGTVNGSNISSTPAANTVPVRNSTLPYAVPGAELAMTGEVNAYSSTSPVKLDMGTVKTGDKIYVQSTVHFVPTSGNTWGVNNLLQKLSGTATITFGEGTTYRDTHYVNYSGGPGGGNAYLPNSGIITVTGDGTLVLGAVFGAGGSGVPSSLSANIYAFFLKKQ